MLSGREKYTLEERYAIRVCFKLGKNATETYRMLQTTFGPSFINRASVFEWQRVCEEGKESVRVDERCGRSKEVCEEGRESVRLLLDHLVLIEHQFLCGRESMRKAGSL